MSARDTKSDINKIKPLKPGGVFACVKWDQYLGEIQTTSESVTTSVVNCIQSHNEIANQPECTTINTEGENGDNRSRNGKKTHTHTKNARDTMQNEHVNRSVDVSDDAYTQMHKCAFNNQKRVSHQKSIQ